MTAIQKTNVYALVLAAGSSSRMYKSKQLLPVDGQPLLLKAVNCALHSRVKNVIVVLGANEPEHRALLYELPVEMISNNSWQDGMGSSIKSGVAHILRNHADADGMVVMACDQPLITTDHLNKLIALGSQTGKPIIASHYASTNGIPVFFDKSYFTKLHEMEGAHGAKKILQENPQDVLAIPFPEGEIDLDTPEDYDRFINP
jgi:molybdenum cofactor cytidylyltransferase